ncbi:methyltransferase domain-containing protein [candidate division GN15 bacterium]|nr:methyltransferase domain-containing protein [candidate division GN15 bacterium]
MDTENKWQAFFDRHAPYYLKNEFTGNTVAEVDFVLEELQVRQGAPLLDVGCGVGRHAIELARRGYQVTGLDISEGMLAQARAAADEAGVTVEWVQADATAFATDRRFDGAVCLCEGAFGLLGGGHDPYEQGPMILRNIHRALQPEGRLIITVLNGCRTIRAHSEEDIDAGIFDPLILAEICRVEASPGEAAERIDWERGFVPSELILLLRTSGFRDLHLWGGTAGSWGRRRPKLDEMELMAVAERLSV